MKIYFSVIVSFRRFTFPLNIVKRDYVLGKHPLFPVIHYTGKLCEITLQCALRPTCNLLSTCFDPKVIKFGTDQFRGIQ